MGVKITFDDGGLSLALRGMAKNSEDLRPLFTQAANYIEDSVRLRFESGRGPGGRPWKPSRRAQEQNGQTLVDRGRLRRSITSNIGNDFAEVGSDAQAESASYAATHQFGARITPRNGEFLVFSGADGGMVFAREVNIPARPFLGFDEEDRTELELISDTFWQGPVR
jgi:phage virion morphogenesis protein|tara:strand:- start:5166 stop:5666 length:501 start_codon:yes stop_codon:yes gene_type:complete